MMAQLDRPATRLLAALPAALLASSLVLLHPLLSGADEPVKKPYAEMRDQGIHYLKLGKRSLALQSLEQSWRSGGQEDEKLVLVLAKLHQEDGNIERVFQLLDAGLQTDRIASYKEQLGTLFGRVQLDPVPGAASRKEGRLAIVPEEPIINPEKKAYFASLQQGVLAGKVKLPLELILPTGRYRVNGRPLEALGAGKTCVEVPFYKLTVMTGSSQGKRGHATAPLLEGELGLGELRIIDLANSATAADAITETATREPSLLVAIGLEAAQRAYKDLRSVPLLMLDVDEREGERIVRRHRQATAVWSDIPRRRLFEKARELLPSVGRVGVVLNRDRSWVTYEAVLAERPEGMRLVPALVTSKGGIAANLLRLRPHIDALWILPDPQLFDPRAVYLIAAWSYREKIPLLVEELDLVNQGAMLGASVRWEDVLALGVRQARKLLWEELHPSSVPAVRVEEPSWGLNLAVSRHLGVEVTSKLLETLATRSEEVPLTRAP